MAFVITVKAGEEEHCSTFDLYRLRPTDKGIRLAWNIVKTIAVKYGIDWGTQRCLHLIIEAETADWSSNPLSAVYLLNGHAGKWVLDESFDPLDLIGLPLKKAP